MSLKSLAIGWETAGEISTEDKEEIIYMVDNAGFEDWRPLVYVIPRAMVESRLTPVPANKRASFGPEYIIADLHRHEFDIIEL